MLEKIDLPKGTFVSDIELHSEGLNYSCAIIRLMDNGSIVMEIEAYESTIRGADYGMYPMVKLRKKE